jgi:lysylphosphatidylglycerol synthetase-like protein (DUF2156 family)
MNQFCRLLAPALESYAAATGLGDPTLDDDVVADLLSDLRHWCDLHDWDFGVLDCRGYNNYISEVSVTAGDDQ